MIDLINAKKYFKTYTSNYNPEVSRINFKIVHTYHVTENSRKIAELIGLSEEDQDLAELIGLLHDIGRFEQVRIYNTFADEYSINHAEKGIEVLFSDNEIRNFIQTNKYDNIIQKAILNHNKFKIEENLNEKELLHSKIIRDADKLDIFRACLTEKLEDVGHIKTLDASAEILTPQFYEDFKNQKPLLYANCKTNMDVFVCIIAFIYDFNFKETLKIVKEQDCIRKFVERINPKDTYTKEKLNEIQKLAMNFIEEKIK